MWVGYRSEFCPIMAFPCKDLRWGNSFTYIYIYIYKYIYISLVIHQKSTLCLFHAPSWSLLAHWPPLPILLLVFSWGDWSRIRYCPLGQRLISFQLRVEGKRGLRDDTAVNNIKFRCTGNQVLEGDGNEWGEYGVTSNRQVKYTAYIKIIVGVTTPLSLLQFCQNHGLYS